MMDTSFKMTLEDYPTNGQWEGFPDMKWKIKNVPNHMDI
jgi:hypothetical protein